MSKTLTYYLPGKRVERGKRDSGERREQGGGWGRKREGGKKDLLFFYQIVCLRLFLIIYQGRGQRGGKEIRGRQGDRGREREKEMG